MPSLGSDDMMTSSNGNIFRVTGPLCGEFTGTGEFPAQRPVTRSFDVFFYLRSNKWLSKQWGGWWFETPSWSLWRQCNELIYILMIKSQFEFSVESELTFCVYLCFTCVCLKSENFLEALCAYHYTTELLGGLYWFHSVHLSIRLSVPHPVSAL